MKAKILILGIISTLFFLSCSEHTQVDSPKDLSEEINMIVSNQYVDYYIFGSDMPSKGIYVKEEKSNDWISLHETTIKDFEYTEGYEYNLKVLKTYLRNPPMDGSSVRYELINIISKTEK